MSELTLGETRMRIEFGYPQPGSAYSIRESSAEIINVLEDFKKFQIINDGEATRLISIAQTEIEKAAEIAVKSVTITAKESISELVSFGNYLLSEKREKSLKYDGVLTDETIREVHDTDLANWKNSL